jgi:hypothetical protein
VPRISLIHGSARQLLLPIYGLDQAIVAAGMMLVMLILLLMFDPEAAPFVLVGGWVGIWITQAKAAPARATVPSDWRPALIATLERVGWRPDPDTSRWVPPAARWARWSFVEIRLESVGSDLQVTGPDNNLTPLLELAAEEPQRPNTG